MAVIRDDRVTRFKAMELVETPSYAEHVNALGMILSLLGLLMKVNVLYARNISLVYPLFYIS